MVQTLWKTVWKLLTKFKMHLHIYPKELKTYVFTKTCKGMFTAALFIITTQ